MKKTIVMIISILVVAGLLAGCGAIPSISSSGKSTDNVPQRLITVTGTGNVTLIPDIAYVTIGVHTEGTNVSEALASNTSQAQKVADALKALGVEQKDIQTTAFNVYPQQQYGPMGEMLDVKYMVDNSVYVTVRDLTKVGQVLDTVVKSGANNINGISFDVADRTKALSEARKKAVENANAQATEMASAAGATLGAIQTLSINSYSVPYQPMGLKADAMGVGGTVPVSAGQMQLTVDVYASYLLK